MKIKLAIAAIPIVAVSVLGYAYISSNSPLPSQFIQTCEKAVQERLVVPKTYQRVGVNGSRKIITFDEFFADPSRNVPEPIRSNMIKQARGLPVQYVAFIEYQAQDFIGAITQERATCTFISFDGSDAPTRTTWVKIDNEFNFDWAKRQPDAQNFERRMRENM
jgi:hypothetical protein